MFLLPSPNPLFREPGEGVRGWEQSRRGGSNWLEPRENVPDEGDAFGDLVGGDEEWRGEPDFVAVRWLSEQPVFHQAQADFPGSVRVRVVDHDCVQQAFAAYGFDARRFEAAQAFAQEFSHRGGVLCHVLVFQYL